MSNYIVITDYAAKDALLTGNPSKLGKGTEIKADLDAIAVAIATKYDSSDTIPVTSGGTGVTTSTGTGSTVLSNSPTLVTPALGTPSALVGTNITGTAAGLTANTVTTNANLTGHVTSTGNAAVLGSFTLAQLNTAVSDANVAAAGANSDITSLTGLGTAVLNIGSGQVYKDASGNVGIGTSSPTVKLEIAGKVGTDEPASMNIRLNRATATNFNGIAFAGAVTYDRGIYMRPSSDTIYIGRSAGGPFSDHVAVDASGNVGIGLNNPTYQLQVNTDSAAKPGVGGVWTVVSDERIKTDIVPADLDRCYEIVKSVPLKHFAFAPGVYSEEQVNDKKNLGWIAQDVQKVFPKAVSIKPFKLQIKNIDGENDIIEDCLDLNGGQMHAAMYGAVQALMAKVETLTAAIQEQQAMIVALAARLTALEAKP